MTHEVTDRQTLKKGNLKYLFFSQPPALWQSDSHDEEHAEILAASQRKVGAIAVAGGISVLADNQVVVDGFGSDSLHIRERSSAQVAEFIGGLKGVEQEKVIYYGQPR